jgi:hypothetical protein
MFDFFKKKKEPVIKKIEEKPLKSLHDYTLEEVLDGQKNYKIFTWSFESKNATLSRGRIVALKDWVEIEKVLDILEKEYKNIEDGGFMLKIKDTEPSCDGDEIASLEIQIKHGYMRPYMKYRAEGAVEAEEWKEYVGQRPSDENNEPIYDKDFEFGWDSVPIYSLTKDISLIKTIFKEFYETGDVSEEYMH